MLNRYVIVGAVAGLAVVLLLVKKNGIAAVGAELGGAAVDMAGGVVAGAAQGVGDVLGIPRTNETECEKAMREGRYWDASFSCPAGTFIGGAATDAYNNVKGWFE
ncbi:hypothetical protein [Massilia sp. GCM10023247]|uniref:hypothetical protein n=1 Tax=Massilia sp. GCM10023247 TaxID=3252643 RepID=UPI00360C2D1D